MFTLKNALVVVITIALQIGSLGFVHSQEQFQTVPPAKMAPGESTRVTSMLKGKEGVDPAPIKRYVQNEFSRLTNPADAANYAAIRTMLLNNIRNGSVEAAKKVAADQVIVIAKVIAAGNYHPHARVNAMLALAELELQSNLPYSETFLPLVNVAKDENQALQMRAIALFGLNRHARFTKLTPAYADGLAKAMTVIVSSEPKSSLDVKGHAWMVRRSFDVLTSLGAAHAVNPAVARLLNDKELPSVRLAAADYLPRVDTSKLTDEKKTQYFIGLAQLLEQQLVMWYEREEDTLSMKSGAMAGGSMGMGDMGGRGMGSMGMGDGMGEMGMGDGGMGMGGEGMGSMGMGDGGMGMGSGSGMGMGMGGNGPKPKPLETQPWEVRMTRRYVNQILQTVHVALDAKQLKGGRPVSANAKGLIDLGLPAAISEPASDLLKSVESLQTRVNDSFKITTMNSLLAQSKKPIENIMDLVREVPALAAQYPKYQVEKDDLKEAPNQPEGDAPDDNAAGDNSGDNAAGGNAAGAEGAAGNNAAKPSAEGN